METIEHAADRGHDVGIAVRVLEALLQGSRARPPDVDPLEPLPAGLPPALADGVEAAWRNRAAEPTEADETLAEAVEASSPVVPELRLARLVLSRADLEEA